MLNLSKCFVCAAKNILALDADRNDFQFVYLFRSVLHVDLISFHLNLLGQQLFRTLPQLIEYFHSDHQTALPDIVLAKLYSLDEDLSPDLYLVSIHLHLKSRLSSFTGRTHISAINRCSHIRTFSNGNLHFCRYSFKSLSCSLFFLSGRFFTDSISSDLHSRSHSALFSRRCLFVYLRSADHTQVECFTCDDQLFSPDLFSD